jgi:hypothetical protein
MSYLLTALKGEPTSGLEPLTCSLRVITQPLQGCAGGCKYRTFRGVPFPALLRVAPYCVPGGIRLVSNGIDSFSLDSPLNLARSAQGLQKENFKLTLNNG